MTTATRKQSVVDDIDAALRDNEKNGRPEPHKARRRSVTPKDVPANVAPDVKPYELKSFTSRDVPWAKIGAIGEPATTAADAAERGGLNFEVELLDAGFKTTEKPKPGTSAWRTISHRKACVRKDTNQFFSFVSSTYQPVQYGEAFTFMDEISPRYLAAGALGGGRQGFMVVQIPERETVELKLNGRADTLDLYAILRTSHDLTRAVEVAVMTLRGKCMNALTLSSFTANAQQRWAVKHVGKDPMAKLAAATTTLTHISMYVDSFVKTANELAAIKLEMEDASELVRRILPNRPRRDEQVNAIVHAWRESPTNGFPDNGWGLVNAVSEYFEWGRSEGTRTDQSRFTSGLTGQTNKYVNRCAQQLLRRR